MYLYCDRGLGIFHCSSAVSYECLSGVVGDECDDTDDGDGDQFTVWRVASG